jgi:NitT/TauT family transport system substrate-binding protein
MTLDYIKANPDKSLDIMAKRAGVSVAEYKEYDAGTTIFTLEQNTKAFSSGNDMTYLNFAADEISKFLLENDFVEEKIDFAKVFEPRFVRAYEPAS